MIDAYHEDMSGAEKSDAISHISVRHALTVLTTWLFRMIISLFVEESPYL
jgi:hypothetical protein